MMFAQAVGLALLTIVAGEMYQANDLARQANAELQQVRIAQNNAAIQLVGLRNVQIMALEAEYKSAKRAPRAGAEKRNPEPSASTLQVAGNAR